MPATLVRNAMQRFHDATVAHRKWLRVFIEGDSWFAFPGITNRTNIITHLVVTYDADFATYRNDEIGDTAHNMLHEKNSRARLRRMLVNKWNRYRFRLMLFSAGGNDVIDALQQADQWGYGPLIQKNPNGRRPSDWVDRDEFARIRKRIMDDYEELLGFCGTKCKVLSHTYDYAIADGRAVWFMGKPVVGPWLQPAMNKFDVPKEHQRKVFKYLLKKFRADLEDLESRSNNFIVVNTQGTLRATTDDWGDEIHPTKRGFKKIARKIAKRLHLEYPDHVDDPR